jgi:hypothetical protein
MSREIRRADAQARRWVDDLLRGLDCDPMTREMLYANAAGAFREYAWHWNGTFAVSNWKWPWMLLAGEDRPDRHDPWSVLFAFCLKAAADRRGWQAPTTAPNEETRR